MGRILSPNPEFKPKAVVRQNPLRIRMEAGQQKDRRVEVTVFASPEYIKKLQEEEES